MHRRDDLQRKSFHGCIVNQHQTLHSVINQHQMGKQNIQPCEMMNSDDNNIKISHDDLNGLVFVIC